MVPPELGRPRARLVVEPKRGAVLAVVAQKLRARELLRTGARVRAPELVERALGLAEFCERGGQITVEQRSRDPGALARLVRPFETLEVVERLVVALRDVRVERELLPDRVHERVVRSAPERDFARELQEERARRIPMLVDPQAPKARVALALRARAHRLAAGDQRVAPRGGLAPLGPERVGEPGVIVGLGGARALPELLQGARALEQRLGSARVVGIESLDLAELARGRRPVARLERHVRGLHARAVDDGTLLDARELQVRRARRARIAGGLVRGGEQPETVVLDRRAAVDALERGDRARGPIVGELDAREQQEGASERGGGGIGGAERADERAQLAARAARLPGVEIAARLRERLGRARSDGGERGAVYGRADRLARGAPRAGAPGRAARRIIEFGPGGAQYLPEGAIGSALGVRPVRRGVERGDERGGQERALRG